MQSMGTQRVQHDANQKARRRRKMVGAAARRACRHSRIAAKRLHQVQSLLLTRWHDHDLDKLIPFSNRRWMACALVSFFVS